MNEDNGNTGSEPEKEPIVEGTINIDFYEGGSVRVRNFPRDIQRALRIMADAQLVMFGHILGLAMNGRLQPEKPPSIIRPDMVVNQKLLRKIQGGRAQ